MRKLKDDEIKNMIEVAIILGCIGRQLCYSNIRPFIDKRALRNVTGEDLFCIANQLKYEGYL